MLGAEELVLILAIAMLLFGANKLPELARSLGSSMGEFQRAQRESELNLRKFENLDEIQKCAKNLKEVPEADSIAKQT